MAVRAVPSSSSSDEVMETLKWARKQGFKPVALNFQSKAAIDEKFSKANYEPPPDDLWRTHNYGIGVVTGPRANGPIDLDLDCTEAVFFAPRFLPPTPAVFGRPLKPSSHMLFRTAASEVIKQSFLDPVQNKTIVELRGDSLNEHGSGHQTVMPGSLHQDTGELIAWTQVPFPDVPMIDAELLYKGVRKIALATLIARHVWMEGQRNEMTLPLAGMLFYLEWPLEEAQALFEAVMDYCEDDDKTRLKTVALTYKKGQKGTKITGATTLRKLIQNDALIDRMLDLAGSPTINLMQEYNERFAVVNFEGKFRVADFDVPHGEIPTFMQHDDFLKLQGPDTIMFEKPVPKAKVWLASPRRRFYKGVDFMPGVEDTGNILNLWPGWRVEPDPKGDCGGWLELLKKYICGNSDELFHWTINWLASIVREPRTRPFTALVLISKPGGGKTLLFRYFGEFMLGKALYTSVSNEEHVYGKFNKHTATTLLLHSEEALFGGDVRHRGIIKSLISDPFRIFEQKGIDAKMVPNYLRLVLSANGINAAPVEADDRRFTVIDMEDRKVKKDEPLVKKVVAEMESSGPGALLDYLYKLNYDSTVIKENVKNEALIAMKSVHYTPMESWWHALLESGELMPSMLAWCQQPTDDPWPEIVSSPALHLSLILYMRTRNLRGVTPNEAYFAVQLNKFTGRKLFRAQRRFSNPFNEDAPKEVLALSNKQNTILNLPNLQDCRRAFTIHVGQAIDWPEALPDEQKSAAEKAKAEKAKAKF